MQTRITGEFFQDNTYYGLREATSRQQLTDMLAAMYPKGAILNVSLTVEMTGQREICQALSKYGKCGDILDLDGTCHATNHVEPEPEPEPELTQISS